MPFMGFTEIATLGHVKGHLGGDDVGPSGGTSVAVGALSPGGHGSLLHFEDPSDNAWRPPRRGLSDSSPQLLPHPDFGESPPWVCKQRLDPKRYVNSRGLAETLVQMLRGSQKDPRSLFLECNPGPGVLTQALLETGAKVVALESDRNFIPHLEGLCIHDVYGFGDQNNLRKLRNASNVKPVPLVGPKLKRSP